MKATKMKSKKFSILLAFFIGLILSIAIMYIWNGFGKSNQVVSHPNEYQLMEVKHNPEATNQKIYGQIYSDDNTEVKMKVSGKIDDDNTSLAAGTAFKKNDILIKVERLKVLYELLMARSEYKNFVQETFQKAPAFMKDKKEKWIDFKDHIHKTQLLPTLPKVQSKKEENFLNENGVYSQYYKIRKLELKAENHMYAAPFEGFIVKSKIHPASTVKKNSVLMTIAKKNSLIVKSHIPINSIHKYENSKQVYYVTSDLDTIGKGKWKHVNSELSDSSTVEAVFTLTPQSSKYLRKTVQIISSEKPTQKGVTLPKNAVKDSRIQLYHSDNILDTSVEVVSATNDSVKVTGLPRHCFVVLPKP